MRKLGTCGLVSLSLVLLAGCREPRGASAVGSVVDEKGRPLEGVEIRLSPAGLATTRRTVSDAGGRFRFAEVDPGLLLLVAEHPGFTRLSLMAEVPEPGTEVDMGRLLLPAGVGIEGVVTDSQGAPVEGAEVSARPAGEIVEIVMPLVPGPISRDAASTDAAGRFRIPDLYRGRRYEVVARHPRLGSAKAPDVEAPDARPIRLRLIPPPSLPGRVVDRAGAPVAGASVILRRWLVTVQGLEIPDLSPKKTATDAQGRFVVTGLEPGEHVLDISAPGYTRHYQHGVEIPETGASAPVEVELQPGTFLEGRVLDESGAPMRGAGVEVDSDLQEQASFLGLTTTDGNGRYRVESLAPGLADVAARGKGGPWQSLQKLELQPGSNRLDLTLPRGNEVSGHVVDENGEPVEGAFLSLSLAHPAAPIESLDTNSSGGGRFAFASVAKGDYRLLSVHPDFAQTLLPLRVDGKPIRDLELRVDRGTVIRGRLLGLAASDWQWIDLVAYSRDTGYPITGVVRPDGTYRIPHASAGPWAITVRHPLRPETETVVRVKSGQKEVVQDLPGG